MPQVSRKICSVFLLLAIWAYRPFLPKLMFCFVARMTIPKQFSQVDDRGHCGFWITPSRTRDPQFMLYQRVEMMMSSSEDCMSSMHIPPSRNSRKWPSMGNWIAYPSRRDGH